MGPAKENSCGCPLHQSSAVGVLGEWPEGPESGVPITGQKCELQGSVSSGRAFERPAEELLVYLLKKEENQVKKLPLKAERN